MRRAWWWLVSGLALVSPALGAWACLVVARPGEELVVRRLGRALEPAWGAGLHARWPLGIDRVERVRVGEVRRLSVGRTEVAGFDDEPGLGEYLTGDGNLVSLELSLLYRVDQPIQRTLAVSDADAWLQRLGEAALARAISRRSIDEVLKLDRVALADETADSVRRSVERGRGGIEVIEARVLESRPPREVAPDFLASQSAQSDAVRREREARTQAAETAALSSANAAARVREAEGDAARIATLAQSEVQRFASLAEAARLDRASTLRRLYATSLARVLDKVRRKLLLPGEGFDLTVLDPTPSEAGDVRPTPVSSPAPAAP